MDSTVTEGTPSGSGFDRGAAVTRSLLGYGVIAGPIYLITGVAQAITRDGFDLSRHSLSLLANGPGGWVQIVNLMLCGAMVIAAAVGAIRAMRPQRPVGVLLAVYGTCVLLSGVFVADPMDGFPPGTPDGTPESITASGALHFVAGGVGFLALAVAYVILGRWFAGRGAGRLALWSRIAGAVVLVGFVAGAATATTTFGIVALWVAVVTGWAWLVIASIALYRTVPHPDRAVT
jgi:hypothetical protein